MSATSYFTRVRYSDDSYCEHAHATLREALDCDHGGAEAVVVVLHDGRPEPVGWVDIFAALRVSTRPVSWFRNMPQGERVNRFGAVMAATIGETINADLEA